MHPSSFYQDRAQARPGQYRSGVDDAHYGEATPPRSSRFGAALDSMLRCWTSYLYIYIYIYVS